MTLPPWLTKPETIYATILFLVSVSATIILGLWPREVRKLLKVPPRKLADWTLKRHEYELALLERLHNNPYRLLLWALWNLTVSSRYAVWMVGISSIVGLVGYYFIGKDAFRPFIIGLSSPLLGAFAGRCFVMYEVITCLYDYDATTARLKASIEKLQADLKEPSASAEEGKST